MSISARRLSRAHPLARSYSVPSDYSGLQLWLKADAIVGLSSGSPISSWMDMSGNGNNASNATSTKQPKFISGATNGLPVVRFDGTDDELFSAASSSYPEQTIVTVIRPSSIASNAGIRGSNNTGGLELRLVSGMPQILSQGVAEAGIVYDTVSMSQFQVLVATYSANTSYSFWLDQTVLGSGANSVSLSTGLTSAIGSGNGQDYFVGDIAEIGCYDRVLTNNEITALISGLTQKWVNGTPAPTVPGSVSNPAIVYTGGATQARLSYTAPASDGGSSITSYTVARDDGGGAESGPFSITVSASTYFYDFTSLKAGNTYALSVTPINAVGNGPTTSLDISVTAPGGGSGIAAAVISDSFGTGDDVPRGVPDGYSWKYDADNDPNNSWTAWGGDTALNTWSQVFVVQSGSPNYNVRIQATDPRLYFFNGTTWTQAVVPSGSPYPMNGAYWSGDFNPSGSADATIRNDGSNLYSVSLAQLQTTSDVFHFWWDGMYPRLAIPVGTQGMMVRTDMRLIADTGYTGVTGAKFIASTCADLFTTPQQTSDPSGTNPGLPEARMKYVTGNWQHFYDTTLSEAVINAYPPPA